MTPEQEISKEFLLKVLDKIDAYWNFLVIGLVAFIGWLVTTEAHFTPLLRVTTIVGYLCFAGMNLLALRSTYLAAETASRDFGRSISTLELPGLIHLAESNFRLKGHLVAVYVIHGLLVSLVVTAICLKSAEPRKPDDGAAVTQPTASRSTAPDLRSATTDVDLFPRNPGQRGEPPAAVPRGVVTAVQAPASVLRDTPVNRD